MRFACRRKVWILLATCFVVASGCALFDRTASVLYRSAAKPFSDRNVLPPIQTSREAMQFEIVFAERPAGDRLLGSTLWQEIDQVGCISADDRKSLAEFGLRVGNAGSSLSPALERLLRMTAKQVNDDGGDNRGLRGRKIYLLSGAEDLIPTGPIRNATISVPTPGGTTTKEYPDATAVFRIKAHRVQDGWVRLEFQPEIHHGASIMRTVPSKDGFATTFSRNIDPFSNCRFSVDLHVGEVAVISADGSDPQSLGNCCFVADDGQGNKTQRVLAVRLTNMAKADAVYGK
jgi:hypothetical protein